MLTIEKCFNHIIEGMYKADFAFKASKLKKFFQIFYLKILFFFLVSHTCYMSWLLLFSVNNYKIVDNYLSEAGN